MERQYVQDALAGGPQVSFTVEVRGIEEVQTLLSRYARLAASDDLWIPTTMAAGEELHRYAVSISPVVTGAYQRAHHVTYRRRQAVVRNVIDYAGVVEARHQVYQRTFTDAGERAAVVGAQVVRERMR